MKKDLWIEDEFISIHEVKAETVKRFEGFTMRRYSPNTVYLSLSHTGPITPSFNKKGVSRKMLAGTIFGKEDLIKIRDYIDQIIPELS